VYIKTMKKYNFNLFADYFQFYIQDEQANGDLSEAWDDEATKNRIALAPGVIGVGTARNMDVPVEIIISEKIPECSHDEYDIINECSIEIKSEKLVVAGCTDYFPDAKRIEINPGIYKVRIYYKNLDTVSKVGFDGEDEYLIVLWKHDKVEPLKMIKSK
jgi:hypothetical protein